MKTVLFSLTAILTAASLASAEPKPNIILVMTDDQGWGETSYNGHPILKTPNLDAMAANGLRLDRFYAGAPNCSPTRASVLTGRSNDRTAVLNHGHALRRQEKVLPEALRQAGYATGHFGKWHLNGFSGPGVPVLATDDRNPGVFGFDEWVSVTNFFDRDPLMSRKGKFEEFKGDSSEVIVDEALKFIATKSQGDQPFFAVIWYGSPHDPAIATEEDRAPFRELPVGSQHHYGELVAMDRSIGTLRNGLRDLDLADKTLVWFNSDNGGLPGMQPETVGGLRGFKGSVFEGGLRVPCVIEWPAVITKPRRTNYPASTSDIFPTLAAIAGLPKSSMLEPIDGDSIRPLFDTEIGPRTKPLTFRHTGRSAIIDNDYKLLREKGRSGKDQLYDLAKDPAEANDLFAEQPEIAGRLLRQLTEWSESVDRSLAGEDYPEGVTPDPVLSRAWAGAPEYQPHLDTLGARPRTPGPNKPKRKKQDP